MNSTRRYVKLFLILKGWRLLIHFVMKKKWRLAKKLGITKTNVSQHLSLMRQQNIIVKTRRAGVAISYSLANPKILIAYDALRKALKEQLEADGKLLEKF